MASFEQLGRQARQAIKAALEPGERIEAAIAGASGSALVATNRRVFIFKKGATTGTLTGRQLNSWDYSNISGVEYKSTITTQGVVLPASSQLPNSLASPEDHAASGRPLTLSCLAYLKCPVRPRNLLPSCDD
jgi:hypothetical protein